MKSNTAARLRGMRKQITLRVPKEVYEALKELSLEAGVPIAHIVNMAIYQYITSPTRRLSQNGRMR